MGSCLSRSGPFKEWFSLSTVFIVVQCRFRLRCGEVWCSTAALCNVCMAWFSLTQISVLLDGLDGCQSRPRARILSNHFRVQHDNPYDSRDSSGLQNG